MFPESDSRNDSFYNEEIHLSHEKKPSYFPLFWLVNKDSYNGLLQFL